MLDIFPPCGPSDSNEIRRIMPYLAWPDKAKAAHPNRRAAFELIIGTCYSRAARIRSCSVSASIPITEISLSRPVPPATISMLDLETPKRLGQELNELVICFAVHGRGGELDLDGAVIKHPGDAVAARTRRHADRQGRPDLPIVQAQLAASHLYPTQDSGSG